MFLYTKVTVEFAENSAVLGSAIYMSQLEVCSWYGGTPPFINDTFLVSWPTWHIKCVSDYRSTSLELFYVEIETPTGILVTLRRNKGITLSQYRL